MNRLPAPNTEPTEPVGCCRFNGERRLHLTSEDGELTQVARETVLISGPMQVFVGGKLIGTTNELTTREVLWSKPTDGPLPGAG